MRAISYCVFLQLHTMGFPQGRRATATLLSEKALFQNWIASDFSNPRSLRDASPTADFSHGDDNYNYNFNVINRIAHSLTVPQGRLDKVGL